MSSLHYTKTALAAPPQRERRPARVTPPPVDTFTARLHALPAHPTSVASWLKPQTHYSSDSDDDEWSSRLGGGGNKGSFDKGENGFLLATHGKALNADDSHQLLGDNGEAGAPVLSSRESTRMSMKDRYSAYIPPGTGRGGGGGGRLERDFTFTGYDIMADVTPPVTPLPKKYQEIKKNQDAYTEACRQLGVTPVSYITRRLNDPVIRARSHGLGAKEARAIAVALVNNERVEELDLTDNCVGTDGARAIAALVEASGSLKTINISENAIGEEGLKAICKAVASSNYLRTVYLAAIGIKDLDLTHVRTMLDQDMSLRSLCLSHNALSDDGCLLLGKAIADNDTLETLDISWNHIRGKGASAIANGVRDNRGLRSINISWNGFGYDGSQAIGQALAKNKTLQELDMSSNRIHAEGMSLILKGLKGNTSLQSLKLANNPISPKGCELMLQAVVKTSSETFKALDIRDLVVTDEFLELLTEFTKDKRPEFQCQHGMVITHSTDGAHEDGLLHKLDPRELLIKLMEKDGLRIIDLFKRLDQEDSDWQVSRSEFRIGIVKAGLQCTDKQLDELIDLLDKDKDGFVDLKEMIHGTREHKKSEIAKRSQTEKEGVDPTTLYRNCDNPAVGLNSEVLMQEMEELRQKMEENQQRLKRLQQEEKQEQKRLNGMTPGDMPNIAETDEESGKGTVGDASENDGAAS